jgi:hypothetical protein
MTRLSLIRAIIGVVFENAYRIELKGGEAPTPP